MYHLATNDSWFNGMKFGSLALAFAKRNEFIAKNPGRVCDIMRHEDGKSVRVVCTSDYAPQNVLLIH